MSAFEGRDKSVIDGGIGAATPVAGVSALRSAWNAKWAEVPKRQPLPDRQEAVSEFDGHVIGQENQKGLARKAEELTRRQFGA
ncbi:MAG TPA: hypothetical protein VII76_15730 [Acidimicrobiales bacterium]